MLSVGSAANGRVMGRRVIFGLAAQGGNRRLPSGERGRYRRDVGVGQAQRRRGDASVLVMSYRARLTGGATTEAAVSLATMFDVTIRENRSRYLIFRDMFSSFGVRTKNVARSPTHNN